MFADWRPLISGGRSLFHMPLETILETLQIAPVQRIPVTEICTWQQFLCFQLVRQGRGLLLTGSFSIMVTRRKSGKGSFFG